MAGIPFIMTLPKELCLFRQLYQDSDDIGWHEGVLPKGLRLELGELEAKVIAHNRRDIAMKVICSQPPITAEENFYFLPRHIEDAAPYCDSWCAWYSKRIEAKSAQESMEATQKLRELEEEIMRALKRHSRPKLAIVPRVA